MNNHDSDDDDILPAPPAPPRRVLPAPPLPAPTPPSTQTPSITISRTDSEERQGAAQAARSRSPSPTRPAAKPASMPIVSTENIQVHIRLRASPNEDVRDMCVDIPPDRPNEVWSDGRGFAFDSVLDEFAEQGEVYQRVAQPLIASAIQGKSAAIIMYGQTGSGKTYTMIGPDDDVRKLQAGYAGVAPRLLDELFEQLDATGNTYGVAVSMLEIYCEQVTDLLQDVSLSMPSSGRSSSSKRSRSHSPKGHHSSRYDHLEHSTRKAVKGQRPKSPSLNMFGGVGEDMHVEGSMELPVSTATEAKQLLDRGMQNRVTAATFCNRSSSRGHAIFVITMQQLRYDGGRITSQLYMCDLAGSEKIQKTGAEGIRLAEASKINTSLLALRKVINMLALAATSPEKECPLGQRCTKYRAKAGVGGRSASPNSSSSTCLLRHTHVPYRDSKLTRLLQNALGGQGRTSVVCTINPKRTEAEETVSTLRFGTAAKSVVNSVVANVKARTYEEWSGMLADKVHAIRELKHTIAQLRQGGAVAAGDCDASGYASGLYLNRSLENGDVGGGGDSGGGGGGNNRHGGGGARQQQSMRPLPPPPPVARCPITRKPFKNPVVAADGHSYERVAILEHFREAGLVSPVTRTRLPTAMIFPNHSLRTICTADNVGSDRNSANGGDRGRATQTMHGTRSCGSSSSSTDGAIDDYDDSLGLLDQPPEIMVLIFRHLRARDLCSLSESCSQLRGFVYGDAAPAERKMLWSVVALYEFASVHSRMLKDAAERKSLMAKQGKGERSLAAQGLVEVTLDVLSSIGDSDGGVPGPGRQRPGGDSSGTGSGGQDNGNVSSADSFRTMVVRKEDVKTANAFDDGYRGFAVLLKEFGLPKKAILPSESKPAQRIQLGGRLTLRYAN